MVLVVTQQVSKHLLHLWQLVVYNVHQHLVGFRTRTVSFQRIQEIVVLRTGEDASSMQAAKEILRAMHAFKNSEYVHTSSSKKPEKLSVLIVITIIFPVHIFCKSQSREWSSITLCCRRFEGNKLLNSDRSNLFYKTDQPTKRMCSVLI